LVYFGIAIVNMKCYNNLTCVLKLFFRVYFPYIIGSKGGTKKRLETETRTRIIVPKMGFDGDIGNIQNKICHI
jgi:hypothetical protein